MESFFFSGRRYDDPLRVSRPPSVPASVQTRSALTRTEIPLRRTGPLARSASRILPRGRGSAVATRLGRRRTDENRQGRGVNLRSPGRRCSRERDPGRGGGRRSRGTVGACPRIHQPNTAMVFVRRPSDGRGPGWTRGRHVRSRCRCSLCSAIHINSRSWLRSSSTHEPSDPPLKVVNVFDLLQPVRRRLSFQKCGFCDEKKERFRCKGGRRVDALFNPSRPAEAGAREVPVRELPGRPIAPGDL